MRRRVLHSASALRALRCGGHRTVHRPRSVCRGQAAGGLSYSPLFQPVLRFNRRPRRGEAARRASDGGDELVEASSPPSRRRAVLQRPLRASRRWDFLDGCAEWLACRPPELQPALWPCGPAASAAAPTRWRHVRHVAQQQGATELAARQSHVRCWAAGARLRQAAGPSLLVPPRPAVRRLTPSPGAGGSSAGARGPRQGVSSWLTAVVCCCPPSGPRVSWPPRPTGPQLAAGGRRRNRVRGVSLHVIRWALRLYNSGRPSYPSARCQFGPYGEWREKNTGPAGQPFRRLSDAA
jgi:hypothetical protein